MHGPDLEADLLRYLLQVGRDAPMPGAGAEAEPRLEHVALEAQRDHGEERER